jgi:RNA polymerase sigma-70 factor (ECF subfamily)
MRVLFRTLAFGGYLGSSANARVLGITEGLEEPKTRDSSLQLHVPLKEVDDGALMDRVQRGDVEAFEVLFDRYSDLVLRVGTRLFRNATEAEDLVQEVFLYLFRKSRVFDASKGLLKSWLIQVTYSRAFNYRKSHNGHRHEGQASEDAAKIQPIEPGPDPERLAELALWRSYFLEAFGSLRAEQRKTIEMYFYGGYTLQEISQETGYSFPSVRNHVYRGLERLRNRLCEDGIEIRRG